MSTLLGKTALVTGASAGIGAATAMALAKAGADVAVAARREDRLSELAGRIHAETGRQTFVLPMDLRERESIAAALDSLPGAFAMPDVLVNNAGLVRGLNKLWDTPPEDFDEMFDVNVKGLSEVCRVLVPRMLARGSGDIINVGSISGHQTYAGGSVYCATKFAVRALTDALRLELMSTPLRVTHISPGLVNTEFSDVRYRGDKAKADATYRGMTPLVGQDVAECIVFAATRPPQVQIADIVVFPTDQAAATSVHRRE